MSEMIKRCRLCGEAKPLGEFYANSKSRDGHLNHCRSCCRRKGAKFYQRNRSAIRAQIAVRLGSKDYRDERNRKRREYARKARAENPEKFRTRWNDWFRKNREHARAYGKAWRARNPDLLRQIQKKHDLKRKYKLSLGDFELMIKTQGSRCRVCRMSFEIHRPVVDHDHSSGSVRGILCQHCNSSIGSFQESHMLIAQAADYVRVRGLNLSARALAVRRLTKRRSGRTRSEGDP